MTAVRFTDDPDSEWVRVNFPYDAELISILKDASRGLRRYDPPTKTWSIHQSVAELVVDAMTASGHQILAGDESVGIVPSVESFFDNSKSDYDAKTAAAEIIASLPGQHVGRVFREMAKALYPDLYRR